MADVRVRRADAPQLLVVRVVTCESGPSERRVEEQPCSHAVMAAQLPRRHACDWVRSDNDAHGVQSARALALAHHRLEGLVEHARRGEGHERERDGGPHDGRMAKHVEGAQRREGAAQRMTGQDEPRLRVRCEQSLDSSAHARPRGIAVQSGDMLAGVGAPQAERGAWRRIRLAQQCHEPSVVRIDLGTIGRRRRPWRRRCRSPVSSGGERSERQGHEFRADVGEEVVLQRFRTSERDGDDWWLPCRSEQQHDRRLLRAHGSVDKVSYAWRVPCFELDRPQRTLQAHRTLVGLVKRPGDNVAHLVRRKERGFLA